MRSMRERTESSASVTGRMQGIHVGGSPAPGLPHHQRSGSQTGRLMAEHAQRQDSFPFDPESSSTLIATAPKGGPKQSPPAHPNGQYQSIGDIMFPRDNQPSPLPPPQYTAPPQQQQQQQQYEQWAQYPPQGLPGQFDPGSAGFEIPHSGGSDSFIFQQNSPFSIPDMGNTPQSGWEQDFINSNGGTNPDPMQWNGENMLMSDQEQLNELERIISNASSRSATPFEQPLDVQNNFTPDSNFDPHAGSQNASGSASPFVPPAHTPSPAPSFHSATSGSPFLNKAQSPPALIIPGQQANASPALPHINTSNPNNHPPQGIMHNVLGTSSGAGGLLPPANPALEHLSGMMGISPIAPNADGPQIYIQPSTPISGLKDGRGLFDAALRRNMAQQPGQGQQGDQPQSFQVPSPQPHGMARTPSHDSGAISPRMSNQGSPAQQTNDFGASTAQVNLGDHLRQNQMRPRAKSDSQMGTAGWEMFDRQAMFAMMAATAANQQNAGLQADGSQFQAIDTWRAGLVEEQSTQNAPAATLDPRQLPGQDQPDTSSGAFDPAAFLQQLEQSRQLAQLQAQAARSRLPAVNTAQAAAMQVDPVLSPTSLAFYQSLGINPSSASQLGTASAPYSIQSFQDLDMQAPFNFNLPHTAGPTTQTFLSPGPPIAMGARRRSFAEGSHPAAGVGTPGYGVELTPHSPFGNLDPRKMRGVSPVGHRRAAKSEDFGRPSGWGVGAGGSTSDFLQSITADDGSLLPPMNRGRSGSHSRHSSGSSVRSPSPALSISSQGSSFSQHSGRMPMPDGAQATPQVPGLPGQIQVPKARVARMKVTSVATEMASTSRRTNEGVFRCPIPGCGSTFTRHFNLKGHLRSHNDERPYKCLYDGCPKAVIGFARQHDCKRHMLLHEGLRPFECEGCGKKFARLDALTRHHKSEQGQECAITHPLPVNPDGSPMTESQYKAYKGIAAGPDTAAGNGAANGRRNRHPSFSGLSGMEDASGDEDIGTGSGMEDYDLA